MADSRDSIDWRNAKPSSVQSALDGASGQKNAGMVGRPTSSVPTNKTPGGLPDGAKAAGVFVKDTRPDDDGQPPLPCLEGPCRHFTEIGQVQGVVEGYEHVRRYQYCERLTEETTTMTLHELNIRYCTRYAPPWWRWCGWRQRLRSAPYMIRRARRTHTDLRGFDWALSAVRRAMDTVGLAEPLGIKPMPIGLVDTPHEED